MSDEKLPFSPLKILGEAHMIAASIPALMFPVLGFAGACIQVRFKEEYVTCLVTEGKKLEEDQLLTNLRMIQTTFYAYSLSFFFLILIHENSRLFNLINVALFTFLNIFVLAVNVYGFIVAGNSKCAGSENGYGPMILTMNSIGLILVIVEMAVTAYLYFGFKSNQTYPLIGENKGGNSSATN